AAFTSVQGFISAQLVPLGSGANGVVTRSTAADVERKVHRIESASSELLSNLVAIADVPIPNPTSGLIGMLDALAPGRAVVTTADPTTSPMVVSSSVGLVYRPRDVCALARALLRNWTDPAHSPRNVQSRKRCAAAPSIATRGKHCSERKRHA